MPEKIEEIADLLIEKAQAGSNFAKAQALDADKQHASAEKLDQIARGIIDDAIEIKREAKKAKKGKDQTA